MLYTTILHTARKRMKLTTNEYCIADMVYKLSSNPEAPVPGWCSASRDTMADDMDMTRRSVINLVNKLVDKKIVVRNEDDHLKTLPIWYRETVAAQDDIARRRTENKGGEKSSQGGGEDSSPVKKVHSEPGEESSQGVKNLHGEGEESSQRGGEESSLNNKSSYKEIYNTQLNDDEDEKNAGANDDQNHHDVNPENSPLTPQVAAAPPLPKKAKKKYGDGVLQKKVRDVLLANPEKFTVEKCEDFLDHWTTIIQNDPNPAFIGQEKWRGQDTFNVERRLTDYVFKRKTQQSNDSATRQGPTANNGGNGSTVTRGAKTGNSRPYRRTPTVTPDMLDLEG